MVNIKTKLLLLITFICGFLPLSADIEQITAQESKGVANEAVQVYAGKVGKLPAVFFIEWAGKDVYGRYFHPSRGRDNDYVLRGTNPRNGVLELKEYTFNPKTGSETYTAKISLRKKIVKGKIIWSGTMFNTDGRKLAISFWR